MRSLIESVVAAALSEATFAFLVEISLKTILLLGLVGIAAAASRRGSAAMRHAIWAGGVSAVLALPVLSYCLPAWNALPIGGTSSRGAGAIGDGAAAERPADRHFPSAGGTRQPVPPVAEMVAERTTDAPEKGVQSPRDLQPNSAGPHRLAVSSATIRRWGGISWFTVASLLAARLFISWLCLRRVVRCSAQVTGGPIFSEFMAARCELEITRRLGCAVAPSATAPLAAGILRPCIILPPAARDWSREQLRSVLLHELAHVRRNDCLTQLIASLVCTLHCFNPLVWLAAWRMQIERESACDDVVLRHGVAPDRYVEQLFRVATGMDFRRILAASSVAMARPRRLEARLREILDPGRNRHRVSVRQGTAILAASFILAVSTAVLRAQPEAPAATEPSRSSGENGDNGDGQAPLTPVPVDRYGDPLPQGATARLGTMRLRLTGWHKSLAFTAGSRMLLTASGDSTVIPLWEPRTGELLGELITDPYPARFMRMFPDGKTSATYGYYYPPDERHAPPEQRRGPQRAIQIWDIEKGVLLSIFEPALDRIEEVQSLTVTPDGKSLVLGTSTGNVRVLDVASGKETRSRNFGVDGVAALAVAPDGDLVAVGAGETLLLWKWRDQDEPAEIPLDNRIASLAFSPDGTSLVSAADTDTKLNMWDVATQRLRLTLEDDSGKRIFIRDIVFANQGRVIIAANIIRGPSHEPGVLLWNAATGALLRRITKGEDPHTALSVSPDGKLLAAMGDSACDIWNLDTGKELTADLVGHQVPIGGVSSFRDDGTIVTGDYAGTVRLWDTATGRQLRMWEHGSWVGAVAASPDGEWIASSADDIRVWQATTGEEKFRLAGHGGGVHKAVGFTSDSRRLVSWGDDESIRIWDMATGEAVSEFPLADEVPPPGAQRSYRRSEAFALSADARRFCATRGPSLHVYDPHNGATMRALPIAGNDRTREIQLSPDGSHVLVCTAEDPKRPEEKGIYLQDITSGKVRWQKALPRGLSGPAGFSPDGTLVAAAVRDRKGALVVWDVATGAERARMEGIPESAWGGRGRKLAISPDNSRLALAMMNTTTLIWDIGHAR